MRRRWPERPLYPVLLPLALPLGFLASNLAVFGPWEMARLVPVLVAIGLGLLATTWLAFRRNLDRAALFTALALTGLVGLADVLRLSHALDLGFEPGPLLAVAVLALACSCFVPAGRHATVVLNALALGILAYPAGAILLDAAAVGKEAVESPLLAAAAAEPQGPPPNIVHIVLDGYGRTDVLREVMGIDNRPFVNALEARGFIVADQAWAPYNQTLLSMSATFLGRYHDGETLRGRADPLRVRLGRLIGGGPVRDALAAHGYRFAMTDLAYRFITPGSQVVVRQPPLSGIWWSNAELLFLNSSLLGRLLIGTDDASARRRHNDYLRFALETEALADLGSPFHLYQHVLAPHPPFSVTADGRDTERWADDFGDLGDGDYAVKGPELRAAYKEGYAAKLAFVSAAVLRRVDRLLARNGDPTVIIIQGDHGSGAYLHQESAARTCHRERFATLLAVYVPDPDKAAELRRRFSRDVSTVDVYRSLFDLYFGLNLPPLPVKTAFAPWPQPAEPRPVPPARLAEACTATLGK